MKTDEDFKDFPIAKAKFFDEKGELVAECELAKDEFKLYGVYRFGPPTPMAVSIVASKKQLRDIMCLPLESKSVSIHIGTSKFTDCVITEFSFSPYVTESGEPPYVTIKALPAKGYLTREDIANCCGVGENGKN